MATAVRGAATDSSGVVRDGLDRPRARFHRANEAELGGWKKSWKKVKKATKKATKTVTKTAVDTTQDATKTVVDTAQDVASSTKSVAEQAKDAYDAGKKLAGKTASATWDNVVDAFGEVKVKKFVGDAGDMLKNKYDATKGFTDDAISTLKSEADDLLEDATAVAEMIVAFFNGLECNISPSTMTSIAKDLKSKAFKSGGTNDLVKQIKADPAKFYQAMDTATCDLIWNTVFSSASLAIDVFTSAISTLKSDCPALGGAKPAFTMGFTLDVDVSFSTRTAGIGTELGVGFDLNGDKFCYVGACASSGRKYGGNIADVDVEPGLALSGYKQLGSVPGECSLIDAGLSINLPTPLKVEGEGGVTYMYGGGLGDFTGVQVPLSISQAAIVPGVQVSFSKGMCCTPICMKTDGSDCAGTNWKNPCPSAKDPDAWMNLITAASEARLGGKLTLDRSSEEHPFARRLGFNDAELGSAEPTRKGHDHSRSTAALAASVALVALLVAYVHRTRRSKLVVDETTPLVRAS